MPSLTIKSVPTPLYERLKRAARESRRSLNGEILIRLEETLAPRPVKPGSFLRRLDALQGEMRLPRLTDATLLKAKREGRP
ncbi:Arc family DNA-binding protein [Candidatus Sumerlaeota bacterium]|nr:Arc family DNA-binding protein [Candidatus Sumerlaeota bacterium]